MTKFKNLQKLFFLLVMGFSLSLVCACGDDEDDPVQNPDGEETVKPDDDVDDNDGDNSSTPSAPVKNTTDRAVSGPVVECGCTYASISGYANLNLLPEGSENARIGIELYLAGDEAINALNGSTNYVKPDSIVVRFSNLIPATEYKYRTYVSYGAFTDNGEWLTFTTLDVPNVTATGDTTNVTYWSATVTASVNMDSLDLKDNVNFGVAWSASKDDLQNNNLSNVKNMYSQSVVDGGYTVSFYGLLSETTYYYTSFAEVNGKYCMAGVKEFTTKDCKSLHNGHQCVNLGLPSGLLWATCNVGATSPEDYGDYFAWGEIKSKNVYYPDNSTTYGLSDSELESRGIIDSDGNLTAAYDAATVNWGGSWRMPTLDEIRELHDECTWFWTTQNGVKGHKATGPNGNSIFLPAAGERQYGYSNGRLIPSLWQEGSFGSYWSATRDHYSEYDARYLGFREETCLCNWNGGVRWNGYSVRPVTD